MTASFDPLRTFIRHYPLNIPSFEDLSRKWRRLAAEHGDAYAQMTLGSNCRIGAEGLPKDYVLAYKWGFLVWFY